MPSTCVATLATVCEYPAWQEPQFAFCGCFTVALMGPGGDPWHELQVSVKFTPKVPVQATVADVPPVKLPWQ
jgi:hypothetical protein